MAEFSFSVRKRDKHSLARCGVIKTKRGNIKTPCFVPVATVASVKSVDSFDLDLIGATCCLVNTYHLHLRPGEKTIKKIGGIHKFMAFGKPIFSDSGGFQAFSLGLGMEHNIGKIGGVFPTSKKTQNSEKLCKVDDKGVEFKSIYDGTKHFLDAKESMKIQSRLGTDIIMAFDECTSPLSGYEYTKKALLRSLDWGDKSLKWHDKKQALYGIIQGGNFDDLRKKSLEHTIKKPYDGIAIGGSLGESKKDMHRILDFVIPQLDNRPRHLLGIGEIDDLFECVSRGIDTFDCVSPTRIARRGSLYISPKSGGCAENKFRINIKAAKHKEDKNPIDKGCGCPTCKNYSRAYLRHLYIVNELSYFRLASMHNLFFIITLMDKIRKSIEKGRFHILKKNFINR